MTPEDRISYFARPIEVETMSGTFRKGWAVGMCVVMRVSKKNVQDGRKWMVCDPRPDSLWLAETVEKREAFRLAAARMEEIP